MLKFFELEIKNQNIYHIL